MSTCPQCGAVFTCAMADTPSDSAPCWCTALPLLPVSACQPDSMAMVASRCFCPDCLRERIHAFQTRTPAAG